MNAVKGERKFLAATSDPGAFKAADRVLPSAQRISSRRRSSFMARLVGGGSGKAPGRLDAAAATDRPALPGVPAPSSPPPPPLTSHPGRAAALRCMLGCALGWCAAVLARALARARAAESHTRHVLTTGRLRFVHAR
jgi:hypothetical protein